MVSTQNKKKKLFFSNRFFYFKKFFAFFFFFLDRGGLFGDIAGKTFQNDDPDWIPEGEEALDEYQTVFPWITAYHLQKEKKYCLILSNLGTRDVVISTDHITIKFIFPFPSPLFLANTRAKTISQACEYSRLPFDAASKDWDEKDSTVVYQE